jgi:hypothetical protein
MRVKTENSGRRTGKQIDILLPKGTDGCTMQAASAIHIQEELKEKLQELKCHPKESYNSVIERLLTSTGNLDPSVLRHVKGSRKHWLISCIA